MSAVPDAPSGEIGLTSTKIEEYENSGYVMSGNRCVQQREPRI